MDRRPRDPQRIGEGRRDRAVGDQPAPDWAARRSCRPSPAGSGPQADRSLVLWRYTDLADPRIAFERNAVRIRATPAGPALKVGLAPSDGAVAYRLDGEVFEKRIDVDPDAEHVDRGAAVQVYLCDEFVELETLGPLRVLEPGEATTHRERWSLRSDGSGGGER